METTVEAIVLRRRDSGESDRRLTLFSLELGKFDAVAKGARNVSSRLRSVSEPLSVATFTFAAGKKQKYITQAQPKKAFRGLRADYDRLMFALNFAEIVGLVLPYEEPFEEAYQLLEQTLKQLEVHPKPEAVLAWAEVQLLSITGFLPSFSECVVTGVGVQEQQAFLSPKAGGYVVRNHAGEFSDRFIARAETLYGLNALISIDSPPKNLRFSKETLVALTPFWEQICESPLSAREQLLKGLVIEG